MRLKQPGQGVRQPPVEVNHGLLTEVTPKKKADLINDHSYVGFSTVVAPFNQNVPPRDQDAHSAAEARNVQQLLGTKNTTAKMAPSLHSCFRFILQQQQIQSNEIDLALKGLGNVQRYDLPLKKTIRNTTSE